MRDEADHTRRWLINAGGAAILSSAIPVTASSAQTAPAAVPGVPRMRSLTRLPSRPPRPRSRTMWRRRSIAGCPPTSSPGPSCMCPTPWPRWCQARVSSPGTSPPAMCNQRRRRRQNQLSVAGAGRSELGSHTGCDACDLPSDRGSRSPPLRASRSRGSNLPRRRSLQSDSTRLGEAGDEKSERRGARRRSSLPCP